MRLPQGKILGKHKGPLRCGAVIVEFAIVCPIILLIVFGTIDVCSFYYLRQSLKVASYESSRVAVTVGATEALAKSQATMLLDSRRIKGYSVTLNPAPEKLKRGEFVTVRVTAPGSENLPLKGWFCGSLSTFGETSMMSDR